MLNKSFCFESPFTERLPVAFKCCGIYGIRHESSGRIYVGSSKDVRARLCNHLNLLLMGKHHSRYLQNAWRKYEQAAFTAVLLESSVSIQKLIEREQAWIDLLDSHGKGFNARPKAESMRGVKWSTAQNEARRQSNLKTWSNESLRQKLSTRFKGRYRAVWTADSHKKTSQTLKQRHAENPEWRKKIAAWRRVPENETMRIDAIRASLKRPDVYNARVQQLLKAGKTPARNAAVRKAYFEKFNRKSLGFQNPDEMDQSCLKLYTEGKSCRAIGRLFHIGHHAISSRLRRLGMPPKRTRQNV